MTQIRVLSIRNYLSREDRDFLDDAVIERGVTSPDFLAMVNAALARRGDGLRVERGVTGTTEGRPWALVAPAAEKKGRGE
jgi:hypothetical protein